MNALAEPKAKGAKLWTRDPLDYYVEPPRTTEALLRVEQFAGWVWDPACGSGNIVRACLAAGKRACGTDIMRRVPVDTPWFGGELDFLAFQGVRVVPNVMMNPPFFRAAGAEAFIRKALTVATERVAAFVDIRFLAGAERAAGLFRDHPPDRVWIVTPRVSCPPGAYLEAGGKAGNGSSDWCWLVWHLVLADKPPRFPTELRWLR